MSTAEQKVDASHLKRNAYLYVRQSTQRQVLENTESTERQYALRCQAAALGWSPEQIIVIDSDLGQSGASAADRAGFQRLVTEVSLGRAGMVLGLEVSRLARNCADWHRLLEICAVTGTLILDQDGLYNPAQFNDRLVLGLKGTMSEAELHMLRARLHGGSLNKAKRGELAMPLPIGLVYNPAQRVVLDPDKQVQQSVHLVFETFRRTGSAFAVVRTFREQALLFPRRRRGEALSWRQLSYSLLIRILHNPRYAGAFVYGRTKSRKNLDGTGHSSTPVPMDQWPIVLRGAHPGYLSWEQFEANLSRLRHNACAGQDNRKSPPREGPALLQGLALCGICGQRMHPRYHLRGGHLVPDYTCPIRIPGAVSFTASS
jgi:DNA invertase Pin-like site-specific DNA recombinase